MSEQQPVPASRGAGLMVSYEELVRIRTYMAGIDSKLDAALALKGQVDGLDKRVATLERVQSYQDGSKNTKNTIQAFVVGLVTAALGGGALMYLPKLGTVLLHISAIHN